jgi:hypothetical protein
MPKLFPHQALINRQNCPTGARDVNDCNLPIDVYFRCLHTIYAEFVLGKLAGPAKTRRGSLPLGSHSPGPGALTDKTAA